MNALTVAAIHTSLPAEGGLPTWIQLVPAGTFSGMDGRGPYKLDDPQTVIRTSLADGKLPIDENHATDFALKSGIPSPARGWIIAMEARPDGIWGRVDWTPTGAELVSGRAYRGISPVFECDKNGNVLRVQRAALTNTPNLQQLATLHFGAAPMASVTGGAQHNHRPTEEDVSVCKIMGIDPAKLAAHKTMVAAHAANPSIGGLSEVELSICRILGIDPAKFAESKRASAAEPDNHGFTEKEIAIFRRMGIDPAKVTEMEKLRKEKMENFELGKKYGLSDSMLAKKRR